MNSVALLAVLSGIGVGLSLIVVIDAQNAFVLRQGLRGEHVLAVVAVCALSDVVLIGGGVAGLGLLLDLAPHLIDVLRVGGAAFLVTYGLVAARRALHPSTSTIDTSNGGGAVALWPVLATALALTWLNPHVYLDTVLLLGSVAATHGAQRWWFGAGAAAGSALWFTALGFGAQLLRPVFARPIAWQLLDAFIAVVMIAIAVSLLAGIGTG